MTRGTREYIEAGKKIRILKGIIQEHNEQLQATSKGWSFSKLSHEMNKHYLAVTTFLAAFAGILYSGKQAISMFAEFDDKVSDVMKTTDLSKETVYALNEELKKIDTRTAQLELLDLGRIAGKFNIKTKEDVEGFIRASDKVVVALKEDLGGSAEEAVRQIGKLVSVFGVKDKFGIEDAILKTGSALNELGMASTANEGYIVQFAKRVAGVAPTARISLQDVMGLAATLDHLGQTSEVSSTAYSQVVTGMFKDTEAYARAARMSVESFSKLLKKDANEAFLKLLEGLHNNDAGMEELIKSMGDLDLEGKRAISVIGVLSNNTKLLREQQKISNREFAKGTSLQQEFNVKNNNAQAILEKKRKILNNLAIDLGQKLMPVLTVSTSGFTYFVKAVSILADFAIRNSGAIIRLTASIAAYTIASKLTTLWVNRQTQATLAQIIVTKARAFAEGASIAVTQLYAAATMLLSGNVKGATQAVRAFNTVIKVSPIGLLVGLLTLAAGAMITFWNRTEEVVSQGVSLTKEIIRLQKEKTDQIIREKNELNGLVSQIMLTNENSSVRKELIKQLQTLYPDFLKNLDAEKVTNQELAGQLGIVNAKYREKARIAALSAKSEAITKKMTDNESSIIEAQDYLKTHRTPNLDPRSPEAMEIQANINAVKRLTRENENYLVVLEDLDKRIVDLKNQNNANSEDWWTKKIVELTWAIADTKRLMGEAQKSNDYLSFQNLTLDLEDYNKQLLATSQNLQNIQKKKPSGTEPATPDPFDPTFGRFKKNAPEMVTQQRHQLSAGIAQTQTGLWERGHRDGGGAEH
ncbi:MAG: phage tail tape measure protein [Bacteroidales bacterium]|nr:phage tail tape measure protein [Bacteroidales bacterium]